MIDWPELLETFISHLQVNLAIFIRVTDNTLFLLKKLFPIINVNKRGLTVL